MHHWQQTNIKWNLPVSDVIYLKDIRELFEFIGYDYKTQKYNTGEILHRIKL